MNDRPRGGARAGAVVLSCAELGPNLAFFQDLGFRLTEVVPADDPQVLALEGFGLRLRLERGDDAPGVLRLAQPVRRGGQPVRRGGRGAREERRAPNGTRVLLVDEPALELPELRPSFVVTRAASAAWNVGRAGMRYRDLVPDRQGGRFVASHIQIPEGGAVPDYVHYHRVRFQLIFCRRGWVRVVYEDQGEPFVLRAGDAVLQPPEIRHRVLECSPGLEVVEVGSPACHATLVDHELGLPTAAVRPERDFGGQRFVRHQAETAAWGAWRLPGFEAQSFGLDAATRGVGEARVVRPRGVPEPRRLRHSGELQLWFVLRGTARLETEGSGEHDLGEADAAVVPPELAHGLSASSSDLELLEVTVPAF